MYYDRETLEEIGQSFGEFIVLCAKTINTWLIRITESAKNMPTPLEHNEEIHEAELLGVTPNPEHLVLKEE